MERKSVTYGVYGIMEWLALIPAGRCVVRVNFTGGQMSAYGVTPATFTTANAALCRLIENSSYYRCGKIVRVK
jgi:hypothetical protein